MALSFLRHLKPETLKSRKRFPATETPIQTDIARSPRLNDESPADDTISGKDIMAVGGGRAEEEEEESGISMDSSSEFSRRESDESQETDPEVASTSTIEDLEDGRTGFVDDPVENETVSSEGHLEDATSDICSDAETESGEHLSESLEHHHSKEHLQYFEAHLTDNLNCSPSLPQVSDELHSEPEIRSAAVPTLSSSNYQHDEDAAADDLESYLSTTSRQEPGAFINSQSSRLSNSEDTDSLHSQDSSDISVNTINTPPVPPPPAPPLPPPGLGLLLPGDHTTSSTTDFPPTSVSRQRASAAAGRDAETEDDLMRQIKAAANKMSNQKERFSQLDSNLLKAKPPTQFPESFSSDLKSVIASRQSRIGTSETDGGEIPGKVTFYKSMIGIPPDDTELRRVFLKRASKATPETTKDEQPAAYQEVRGTRVALAPISDSRKSSAENTKQFKASNGFDVNKFDANVAAEVTEQSTSADEDARTGKYEDTEQNVSEEMPWQQNESDDTPDNIPSTMIQNSGLQQDAEFPAESHSDHETPSGKPEEEFDKVVDDFDNFLEENVSTHSWKDPSEIPLTSQSQIETISPVLDPQDSDADFRNGDNNCSPEPAYTNGMNENSSSFSPNLSTFSEAESPVFEEMDELVISTSAQTVQEHSKRLSQPLESYNILPTIKETSTKSEPKTKFSFRNIVSSVRHTIGRRKQSKTGEEKRFSVGDASQMKVDENWSIHDTVTQRGHAPDDRSDNKSRSLKDVFTNYDVKSLSEFTDSDKNAGKDFSVRNWKEVMERSNGDIKNISDDQGNPNTSTESAGFAGLLTKRANSTPNLGSLSDLKYTPQNTTKPQLSLFSAKNSRALKKPKSSNSKTELDDLTSNTSVESPSRQGSSNLNSTLPSRRLHGMMQSFDSIYPGAPAPNPNRYQKKTEPRKFSLPGKGTAAGILSPVQRRKQRSQQSNR